MTGLNDGLAVFFAAGVWLTAGNAPGGRPAGSVTCGAGADGVTAVDKAEGCAGPAGPCVSIHTAAPRGTPARKMHHSTSLRRGMSRR